MARFKFSFSSFTKKQLAQLERRKNRVNLCFFSLIRVNLYVERQEGAEILAVEKERRKKRK